MGIDVLLALKLSLGEVILAVFADGRALAVLGDLGEFLFGLGELALLNSLWAALNSASAAGSLGGLVMGLQPSEPRISVDDPS